MRRLRRCEILLLLRFNDGRLAPEDVELISNDFRAGNRP